ncbi:M23 family metallopeptidase [Phormidium yuhuli AB48]|uniref:M23 family metallopeptidase n=1 Tax=Phormidium yuhuli AB48 TaxID=2940671 RepID=A0ABY5ALI8_9CYAN|nr:M23 family metallopeptidase [Phormidium yuhuli]USR89870.1 M23 family metallopeptidase [Phormidium yuhuli AB48]
MKRMLNLWQWSRSRWGRWCSGFLLALSLTLASASLVPLLAQDAGGPSFPRVTRPRESFCPPSALSRVRSHTVAPGETLQAIADGYNLFPTTLMGMNPQIRNGQVQPGMRLRIPPFDGIEVNVSRGQMWEDLAQEYNVRADVLFEVNNCNPPTDIAFIPGANWNPHRDTPDAAPGEDAIPSIATLAEYPLPNVVEALLGYGWVLPPGSNQVIFHSGVDLPAEEGTSVRVSEDGIVAFAGRQDPYGNFVVINHSQGRQTRYAHLETLTVEQGEFVDAGQPLGTVGTSGEPDVPQPHLHFEVRSNTELGWVAQNPATYL